MLIFLIFDFICFFNIFFDIFVVILGFIVFSIVFINFHFVLIMFVTFLIILCLRDSFSDSNLQATTFPNLPPQAAMESLVSGAICGISYHLFSGQPLTILGSTGPVLVFETIIFGFSKFDLDFFQFA